jgi:hypothetical protein
VARSEAYVAIRIGFGDFDAPRVSPGWEVNLEGIRIRLFPADPRIVESRRILQAYFGRDLNIVTLKPGEWIRQPLVALLAVFVVSDWY